MKDIIEFLIAIATFGIVVAFTTLILRFGWLSIDQYFGLPL